MSLKPAEINIALLFSDSDITLIDAWLKENLPLKNRIQRPEIYAALKDKTDERLDELKWSAALSFNIKSGRLAGYDTVRGRFGGVCFAADGQVTSSEPVKLIPTTTKPPKGLFPKTAKEPVTKAAVIEKPVAEVKPEPVQQPIAKPVIRTMFTYPRHVWIGQEMYKVSAPTTSINRLLVDVLKAVQNENGNVTFNGKKWQVQDVALLERFLIVFMHSVSCGSESVEPVLDDESGVPAELRVSSAQKVA